MNTQSRQSIFTVGAAVAIGVLVLFAMCSFQLRVTEQAVVTTLGRSEVVPTPGFHWRFPWPVQKVVRFDRRKQLFVGAPTEITTRDNITLIVTVFASWEIADLQLYFNRVGEMYKAESYLRSVLDSQQGTIIRSHALDDFVTTDGDSSGLEMIEAELLDAVRRQAADTLGIAVGYVGIAQINLHPSNTASVFDRMKQEQAKITAEIRSESEKRAKIIRDNAESDKAQRLAAAEADAKIIQGEANIEAAKQYQVFEQDVEFAIFLRNLDALEETMKTNTTLIIDPSSPLFDLFKFNIKTRGNRAKP